MRDKSCPYADVQTWEHGGEGFDVYCESPRRPKEAGGFQSLCDVNNHEDCRWYSFGSQENPGESGLEGEVSE